MEEHMIRQAESKDALDIERLYRILLSDNMNIKVREDRIEEIKNTPNSFLFVYEEDGRIIATAHLHLCLDAVMENRPFGVIERVVVDPRNQNNGYGKKLMVHIESL